MPARDPCRTKQQGKTMRCSCTQVQGSRQGSHYTVFPQHYCSCQAFLYTVIGHSHPLVSMSACMLCYVALACCLHAMLRAVVSMLHASPAPPNTHPGYCSRIKPMACTMLVATIVLSPLLLQSVRRDFFVHACGAVQAPAGGQDCAGATALSNPGRAGRSVGGRAAGRLKEARAAASRALSIALGRLPGSLRGASL